MSNEVRYYYSVLAFIDVLDQQGSLKAMDELNKIDPEYLNNLGKLDEKTAGFIESLRLELSDDFDSYNNPEDISGMPDDKKRAIALISKRKLEIQTFSDSIHGYAFLENGECCSQYVNGIIGLLMTCGNIMCPCLACGYPLRIGIETGLLTKLSNGEAYGPALSKAYALEGKVCQWPRIVVGDGLLKDLKNLSEKKGIKNVLNENHLNDLEWCKEIADLCLQMITVDIDGVHIFDYLGEIFVKNVIKKGTIFKDIFASAFQFVEDEYSRFKSGKDADVKLAQRYYMLYKYFEDAKKNLSEYL